MKLYGFGCSYTRYHWKTWFDYLSEITELTGVNLAAFGNSNDIIHESVFLQEETCDPDSIFLIMWSFLNRRSVYVGDKNIDVLSKMFNIDSEFLIDLYCHKLNGLPYLNLNQTMPIDDLYFDSIEGSTRRLIVLMSSIRRLLHNRRFLILNNIYSKDNMMQYKSYRELVSEEKILDSDTCFRSRSSDDLKSKIDLHPLPIEHLLQAVKIARYLNLHINETILDNSMKDALEESNKITDLQDKIESKSSVDVSITKGIYSKLLRILLKKHIPRTLNITTDKYNAIT